MRDKDAETDEDAPFVIRKVQTPAGFEIAEEHRQDTSYDVVYTDGKDPSHTIIYSQEQINEVSVVGLDAENDSMKHVDMNGRDVILSKKQDTYTLFWTEGNCAYTLIGNVELDVLKKIQTEIVQ